MADREASGRGDARARGGELRVIREWSDSQDLSDHDSQELSVRERERHHHLHEPGGFGLGEWIWGWGWGLGFGVSGFGFRVSP